MVKSKTKGSTYQNQEDKYLRAFTTDISEGDIRARVLAVMWL